MRNPLQKNSLSIMVGLPLSGKSTLARKLANSESGIVIVCPDTIRLALHGYQFLSTAEPFVWAIAQTMARTLLLEGFTVIVDATNTTASRRKMWTVLAKEFETQLNIFWVTVPVIDCLERNKSISRLDPSIINKMNNQFEPPVSAEGYIYLKDELEIYLNNLNADCESESEG